MYLVRNRGIVLTRDQLLQRVWGYDYHGDPRTLDVHIRWLREKIEEEPNAPRLIQTVRGIGYCFKEPANSTSTTTTLVKSLA
jgi:two-component system alkaline phosphatase synthesis response regulator PhoP